MPNYILLSANSGRKSDTGKLELSQLERVDGGTPTILPHPLVIKGLDILVFKLTREEATKRNWSPLQNVDIKKTGQPRFQPAFWSYSIKHNSTFST